jgi:methylisocitrate lyase
LSRSAAGDGPRSRRAPHRKLATAHLREVEVEDVIMDRPSLRALLQTNDLVFAPGAWDALSALLVQQAGYLAVFGSGFAISASLGMPDADLYTMTENVDAIRRMAAVTSIPIIADIDTGYGNAVNVMRAVRAFEGAGASAVFIEDQAAPKRCPICVDDPVPLIDVDEAAGKIRAAIDARRHADFLIIARTDSRGRDAMERARRYAEAGADLIMPVSKTFSTVEEVRACHQACGRPLLISLTPSTWVERAFTRERLVDAGARLVLLPLQLLYAAVPAMQRFLAEFKHSEYAPPVTAHSIPHHDFIKVIGFPEMEDLQRKYIPASPAAR